MQDVVLPVTTAHLLHAALGYAAFLLLLYLGSIALPGSRKLGFAQPSGAREEYKLSGLGLFLLTTAIVLAGTFLFDLSLSPVLTHFWSLFIVANVSAFAWAAQLFVTGRRSADYSGANPTRLPSWLHDLWFGPLLNPKLGGVDVKMFAYHPSLIGLWIVVAAFAYQQYETRGEIPLQMWLFQAFWWAYLFTHYLREDFMLSTWDIIAENFGLMLSWGDLVYVTFFYPIAGWFLLGDTASIGPAAAMALVVLHVAGHWIFRSSNWQKDRYKRDPQAKIWGRPAEALGGKLLVSGWWGIGRKINYTGEIMVYFSFALCAGFASWVPYLLPVSLIALLAHRAARDDKRCRRKYGDLWQVYCARARFRMLPYVY